MATRKRKGAGSSDGDSNKPGVAVVSVFGPFDSHALVVMTTDQARELVGDASLESARPSRLLKAVEHDIAEIAKRDPELAGSALAASAVAMALEIEHPFNSATSKSMCQARLVDALKELRELAPAPAEKGALVDLKRARQQRLAAGGAGASD